MTSVQACFRVQGQGSRRSRLQDRSQAGLGSSNPRTAHTTHPTRTRCSATGRTSPAAPRHRPTPRKAGASRSSRTATRSASAQAPGRWRSPQCASPSSRPPPPRPRRPRAAAATRCSPTGSPPCSTQIVLSLFCHPPPTPPAST